MSGRRLGHEPPQPPAAGQPATSPGVARQTRWAAFGPDTRERDDVLLAFGGNLRALRIAAGFSQGALAVRCFMRHDQISAFERGVRAPDLPALLVLGRGLGVSAGELIDGLAAPVRRVGTAQVLDLITRQPPISTDAIAASLRLPFAYTAEIALYLRSAGAIAPQRTGWQPTAQTQRAERTA
jgi:transcriptional regulator with XRE-family HTH domain